MRPLLSMKVPRLRIVLPALVALVVTAIGCGIGWTQGSATYLRRFMEETKRVVPPLALPAPTPAEFAAPRGPKTLPIDIGEAKRLIGLDRLGPDIAARIPGGKLGIVDLGFRGLREWLAAYPDEAKLATYHGPNGLAGDPALADSHTPDHGYWIYRVARAVLPDVPIHLYPVAGDSVTATMNTIIGASAVHGVVVFNMSLGLSSVCSLYQEKEEEFSRTLRLALVQYEVYLFISAGNSRAATHTWISADRDNSGYVDLRTPAEASRNPGSSVKGERVTLKPGANQFFFSWDAHDRPQDDYALELVTPAGKLLAESRLARNAPPGACLGLAYKSERREPALLRVKRLAGAPSGTPMRISAYGTANPADFNSLQTALSYAFRENPFVIFVGSFSRTADGKLAPSAFSDIGRAPDGRLVPDVLGPGQLLIDGKVQQGTSFASPFLTALYATRVGDNLKNLVERTGSFARFAPGVPAFERSRLGIPDPDKVTDQLSHITGPTTVSDVTHAVEGDQLVVRYTIERCCMQSLLWYPEVVLADAATGQPLKTPEGKVLQASQEARTEEAGRVKTPVTVRFPIKALADHKGKPIKLLFGLRVRSWRDPPPGSLSVDQAPDYRITL